MLWSQAAFSSLLQPGSVPVLASISRAEPTVGSGQGRLGADMMALSTCRAWLVNYPWDHWTRMF